jgi:hypothetical protein
MAGKKISALTAASTPTGTEQIAVVQSNNTKRATVNALATVYRQPLNRVTGAVSDTALAADIGGVISVTTAGAHAVSLPSLAASVLVGRTAVLTWQAEDAATAITITPSITSQINGAGVGVPYVAPVGRVRITLFSRDGLSWFTG